MNAHHYLAPSWSLVLAALVVMGSPGPSAISVAAASAAFGVRRSLGYACGLVLGTIAALIAVATGAAAILTAAPGLGPGLVAASAAYMLWLAWRIATAPPLSESGAASPPTFTGGFLLAIANPKAYVAIGAVFSASTIAANDRLLDALIKTAILAVMIVVIHLFWLIAGAALSRLLRHPKAARVINILLAISLVAATVFPLLPR